MTQPTVDTSALKGVRRIIGDTETTGLEKDDVVIEVAGVEIIGNVITGNTFHEFINPGRRQVHPDALRVHGITNEFLKDKPPFKEVIERWLEFIGKDIIVFHNAKFDIGMLREEFKRLKRPMITNVVEDTLIQAQRKFPGSPVNLDALCRRFGISNAHRVKHGALLDSELLAEVYIDMNGLSQLDLVVSKTEISNSVASLNNIDTQQINVNAMQTLIVSPKAAEIAQHDEFMKKFIKKNIWGEFLSQNG